jgi:ceramide glucosyltransferase
MRRETLEAIGGFAPFAGVLADDFEIGRSVRARGLAVIIPPMTVAHACAEAGWGDLLAHELRWARTIRSVEGPGFAGSLVTHALPLALAAAICLDFTPAVVGLVFAAWGVRTAEKLAIDAATGARAGPWWLLPARDVLSFAVFLLSFLGDEVVWQGRRFKVGRKGVLTEV